MSKPIELKRLPVIVSHVKVARLNIARAADEIARFYASGKRDETIEKKMDNALDELIKAAEATKRALNALECCDEKPSGVKG